MGLGLPVGGQVLNETDLPKQGLFGVCGISHIC